MRKFLYLIIGLLLCSAELFSQSYGLQFSSHEVIPEKRTSLNLTPTEPLCLTAGLEIAYDFKFIPNQKGYFGYLMRIITTNNQNIDVVYNRNSKKLNFVVGDLLSNNLIIDSAKLFGEWNHCAIQFDTKLQEVRFYINNKFLSSSKLNINSTTCCKVYFGASDLEHFKIIDVPPMQIKDVSIKGGNDKKHFYPLSETTGNRAVDMMENKVALVNNPIWVKSRHQKWNQINTFVISGTPSLAFDKKTESLYIVSKDSLHQLSFKNNQLIGSKLAKSIVDLPAGNQSIVDYSFNKLYNFYVDEKIVSEYSTADNSWQEGPLKKKLTEFWHANKFISTRDTSLYIFGGYGQLQYKNLVQRFHFSSQKWQIINPKGDFFMPRYLAALGTNAASDTAYIIGGYGSKTGDQSINPRHNYELMAYSVGSQSFKKIYAFKQPDKEFCFANSLVVDSSTNQFYGLIYPIDRFTSTLQLIRGSLTSPEYELMGDTIPYSFHDIESFSDLYYCPSSQKLVAVTLFNQKDKSTVTKIFTLDFPPNKLIAAQPINASNTLMYRIFASLFALTLLMGIIFILIKRRKKSQQPVIDTTLSVFHNQSHSQSLPLDDRHSNQGLYETAKETSSIFLFGNLEVIDKEGKDITRQFTPLLKEIFLMILVHTFKDGKGISSDKLYETIWADKPLKDARNNFSVNIVKLKSILEKIGSTAISKETGKWRFEILDNSIKLDYHQFIQLANVKPAVIEKSFISELLSIINRGSFLREAQYTWLDDAKANVSDFVITTILSYTLNATLPSEPDFILKLANCIFQFDQMNEVALEFKCRSLMILGKHGLAKETYINFNKEYKKNYGEDFGKAYSQIIGHQ
jgi:two-component SAPR family response regulator